MAEAFAAFARPPIDRTDGSEEQWNSALAMTQLCDNLALLPGDSRASDQRNAGDPQDG